MTLLLLMMLLPVSRCFVLSEKSEEISCPSVCTCVYLLHEGYNVNCSNLDSDIELSGILKGIPKIAHRIYLENDGIRELPKDAFSHVQHLGQLRLANNEIIDVSGVVDRLDDRTRGKLKNLNLDHNNLAVLPAQAFSALVRLENLHMNWNRLEEIADGAFDGMTSLLTLELQNNRLRKLGKDSLRGLNKLQHLTLDHNRLASIEDDTFSDLHSLRELTLSHNSLRSVVGSSGVLRGLSALVSINLASNGITTLSQTFFNGTPSLGTVFLDHNELTEIPLQALVHLSHLSALYIAHNNITNVTDGFGLLSNLNLAYLSHNQISKLGPNSLLPIHHLKNLWLNDNKLETLPESLRQRFLHMEYGYLLLRNNPFVCDCRLAWFAHWVQSQDNVTGKTYGGDMPRCAGPEKLAGRTLDRIRLVDMTCAYAPVQCTSAVRSPECSHLRWTTCQHRGSESCLCNDGNCFVCPVGSYGGHHHSTTRCHPCPPFSTSPLGARRPEECTCRAGYASGEDGQCQPCPAGTFKHVAGGGECQPCAEGSGTLYTGTVSCDCSPGYTLNHTTGQCKLCPSDTYKHYHGNLPCRRCPQHSRSRPGATTVSGCVCRSGYIRMDFSRDGSRCRQYKQTDWRSFGRSSGSDSASTALLPNTTGHVGARHSGSTEPGQGVDSKLFLILLPVCVILVVSAVLLVVCVRTRLRRPQTPVKCNTNGQMVARNPLYDDLTELPMLSQTCAPPGDNQENQPEWLLRNEQLNLGDVIGQGAFGQVVVATMTSAEHPDGKKVAVKSVRPDAGFEEQEALMSELERMMYVGRHPNVVQLLGAFRADGQLMIVMEYAEGGNLSNYLKRRSTSLQPVLETDRRYCIMSEPDLISVAWQICKGMEHLASLKCVHRDLACRNILLSAGLQAKVSDFGLAREVYENGCYFKESKGRVPFKWMSPEALLSGRYTTKSDVWSFGILLWEICTLGATPYPGIPTEQICGLLKSGYKMSRPDYCDEQLYAIMLRCWSDVPSDRPNFSSLVDWFDRLVEQAANQTYLEMEPDMTNCVPLAPPNVNTLVAPPADDVRTNGEEAENIDTPAARPSDTSGHADHWAFRDSSPRGLPDASEPDEPNLAESLSSLLVDNARTIEDEDAENVIAPPVACSGTSELDDAGTATPTDDGDWGAASTRATVSGYELPISSISTVDDEITESSV